MDNAGLTVLVLAAGKGTRMKSEIPKVMHGMAGKPLIGHVLTALKGLPFTKICVVVGHGREHVTEYLQAAGWLGKDQTGTDQADQKSQEGQTSQAGVTADVVVQQEQLGTAHAVQQALPFLPEEGTVMVLSGDQPLLTPETLRALWETHRSRGAAATILTAEMDDPSGLGRILREDDRVVGIVEQKDAEPTVLEIKEINTGTYCFQAEALRQALAQVRPDNAQEEYYLTDVIKYVNRMDQLAAGYKLADTQEAMGINDLYQLSVAEEVWYDRVRRDWMRQGVRMVCPSTILIEADVHLEADVTLLPHTWLKGKTRIGKGSSIGPQTTLSSCQCGENCVIEYSLGEEAAVGDNCHVGPFGRLRKGAVLEEHVHVGNFVEIKNSVIGHHSKANHLSYIGDAALGEHVNVGAGTITCNYDGTYKNKTVIGDRAFIGSNTNLVAPVSVGSDVLIGAGSTITKDVPDGALAIERASQRIHQGWDAKKAKK